MLLLFSVTQVIREDLRLWHFGTRTAAAFLAALQRENAEVG